MGTKLDAANAVSPAVDKAEMALALDDILGQLTTACASSAQALQQRMSEEPWASSPVIYTIPSMRVSMKVALTATKENVKGILWWRTQQGETTQSVSQIDLEIVAIPRQPGEG